MAAVEETVESLVRAVYPELRQIAARLLRGERDDHTLQRTALVHETFIRLTRNPPDQNLSVERFLALAAHQMREVLVDYGRMYRAQKRSGTLRRVPLFEAEHGLMRDEDSVLALDEAMERLGAIDPRAVSVVELKFLCGFTNAEAAAILGVSSPFGKAA